MDTMKDFVSKWMRLAGVGVKGGGGGGNPDLSSLVQISNQVNKERNIRHWRKTDFNKAMFEKQEKFQSKIVNL